MSINIESWLETAVKNLKADFTENLLYAGLQGSYNRGEATPQSDIDLVVILEKLGFEEIKQYKNILKKMPYYEKTCGFISSRDEIQNLSKEDMFQFYYDTKNLYGRLEDIITPPDNEDIKTAVKRGIENIYHACVHSYLHAEDLNSSLAELYKMTFFILQAEYFLKSGEYIKTKKIEAITHFSMSIKWNKVFGYKAGDCPNTEMLLQHLLMLPCYKKYKI